MVNDYLFQYDIDGGVCGMVPSAHAQLSSRRKVARTSLNYFLFSFLYKNYIRCKFLQIVYGEQNDSRLLVSTDANLLTQLEIMAAQVCMP